MNYESIEHGDADSDRRYLERLESTGELSEFQRAVDRILAVDRDYLSVVFEGERIRVATLRERLSEARHGRVSALSSSEVDALCALGILGTAWIRLEHTEMQLTRSRAFAHVLEVLESYEDALESKQRGVASARALPWWEVARRVSELRELVDQYYLRIAEIDGATWYRREHLIDKDLLERNVIPEFALESLQQVSGLVARGVRLDDYPRSATRAMVARQENPLKLLHAVMRCACEDPAIGADHATLLAPRGTRLAVPWEMQKDDFIAHVVFKRDFVASKTDGVGDETTIERAMLSHHAAKKTRIANKYLAKYGPNSQASLDDNLGSLGLYHNEHAHHKGHVVTGISTALRFLMPIEVRLNENLFVVEGLTDLRVTRSSRLEADRFGLAQFPAFYRYGLIVRAIVEESFSLGLVFPRMRSQSETSSTSRAEA